MSHAGWRRRAHIALCLQRDSDDDEHMIVAFVDEETREGRAMYKLLRKIADENSEYAGTLEIGGIFARQPPNEKRVLVFFQCSSIRVSGQIANRGATARAFRRISAAG